MSDRQKSAFSWATIVGLCFSLIGGAWVGSASLVKLGKVLNGIEVLTENQKRIELKIENDTKEMRQSILEIKHKHDELEHRVDLIERMDSRKLNGYERNK